MHIPITIPGCTASATNQLPVTTVHAFSSTAPALIKKRKPYAASATGPATCRIYPSRPFEIPPQTPPHTARQKENWN